MTSQVHKRQQQRWSAAGPEVVARQEKVLAELIEGRSVDEATASVGVTISAYKKWRERSPEFRTRADRIINARRNKPGRAQAVPFGAEFRKKYLGRETPSHQGRIIDLLTSLKGGEWGLVLIPPGFLKTATVEDYLTHRITNDSNVRCLVVSKSEPHARKIVGTIKARLESNEDLVADYGPFRGRPWSQNRLNVAGKTSDERDYTLESVGMKGQIYGHRCDVILLDDVVDAENAANYEDQFDWLQQVVDTRLSDNGVGIILGTRMAPTDLYERILQEEWAHKILRLPAILDGDSLWPEGKPLEKLLATRAKTKATTWTLTWQQDKLQPQDSVFPLPMIESCFDPRITLPSTKIPDAVSIMGFDPGLAHYSASFVVGLNRETRARTWLDIRNDLDVGEGGDRLVALTNLVVDEVRRFRVTTCVIEGNSAFELFTGDNRLRKRLNELHCNLWAVTADGDGIKGGDKWLPDRPDLTFESLSGLFADRLYRIPASGGAQKHFRPAINQFEDYPGGRKSPKDIISAARLAEYGCLSVIEQSAPKEKGYAEAVTQLEQASREWKIPGYVSQPYRKQLKDKAEAQRNARLWGPDGHFTRRLPRRGANQEQETA